ncbi:GNAT family N-acetyltransferase [Micromonospora sp. NPDC049679]|uniref:GNAT family N-acetyltransferase n=1 Tax=Micromonospora sp. NPDC049679 TaxID=3155920 RepID=UPI0033D86B2C
MAIRRISSEERLTTSFPLQSYAFERSPANAAATQETRQYLPYNEGNVTLVAEESDTVVAAASAIPMRQNIRGTVFPMAGIAGVATHPLARRQGHVRRLLTQLLGEMRDEGHAATALYPFRPSFYERFGYVGFPKPRTVTFSPADLNHFLRLDLPGEVTWQRIKDGYDTYRDFIHRSLAERHGFAAFPDYRAARQRDSDEEWLVMAVVDGETVGAVTYRIEDHAGDLLAGDLLTTGPVGRALLLQFFARHVDQVARVTTTVSANESPELWATDFAAHTEAKISFPGSSAPMARILSMEALHGIAAGPGRVTIEVVDDPFIAGTYLLNGEGGRLEVTAERAATPAATLTAAGISALVYGVLDPVEVALRGFGAVPDAAATALRGIFPPRTPRLFASF